MPTSLNNLANSLGGTEATITDAFLVLGLLDPATYFGGELKIDVERARAAIAEGIVPGAGLTLIRAGDVLAAEEQVALACQHVAHWADQNGHLETAIAFAQGAAVVMPAEAALSYAVGRLARRRAEYARAETWYRRSLAARPISPNACCRVSSYRWSTCDHVLTTTRWHHVLNCRTPWLLPNRSLVYSSVWRMSSCTRRFHRHTGMPSRPV
mgnify:CR=1 FL=1